MPHCTFIREGKTCGAPSYQDPCPTCIAYARTLAERLGDHVLARQLSTLAPVSVNTRAAMVGANMPTPASTPGMTHRHGDADATIPGVPLRDLQAMYPAPEYTGGRVEVFVPPAAHPMDFPKYRALHALLHYLWTKSVNNPDYDKKEWESLEASIDDVISNGLGERRPAPLAKAYGEDPTTLMPVTDGAAPKATQESPSKTEW